jgi:ketosteroid isomerase-like protein
MSATVPPGHFGGHRSDSVTFRHPSKRAAGSMDGMTTTKEQLERIYHAWDDALHHHKLADLLALYAPDATLESPLIPHLLGTDTGVCRGHAEIRALLERVFERKPPLRRHHRTGFLTDGSTLMFEYPRVTPEGEQMDFVEVMEIQDGLIAAHRVYWGWRGVKVLADDAYHRPAS